MYLIDVSGSGDFVTEASGAWIDSNLPADANDLPPVAWSRAPRTARACALVLICVVFDCGTDMLPRCCRAHRFHLERRAPDAQQYTDSTGLRR
jgi:hypothetical protein